MIMFPVVLLLAFLGARMNSAYHPKLLFKKYIKLRNPLAIKLLVSKYDPAKNQVKNAKGNQDKLLYGGAVFYGLFFAVLVFSLVMRRLPDMPTEQIVWNSRTLFFAGDTLNTILPFCLTLCLFMTEFLFHIVNTAKYDLENTQAKGLAVVLYLLFGIAAVCFILAAVNWMRNAILLSLY